jgi:dihydrofolate synthase/folylpolyglutamate synthase
VLIAGTNGKGSTAATLASILQASGHRAGLYTSPHLLRINERIAVNGEPIPDSAFAEIYERVTAIAAKLVASGAPPHSPSFFETMTAIAFEFFASVGVEIAVLEVGMGGRLDATNIVEPILCVITDIDLDHQKHLGNTIAEIAAEKAGILRRGVPAVTLPQHPQANQVLGECMMQIGALPINAARNVPSLAPHARPRPTRSVAESSALRPGTPTAGAPGTQFETRFPLSVMGEEVEIVSPLMGRHQFRNLALAITAAEELALLGFHITAQSIARGTRQTAWPGRFQHIPSQPAKAGLAEDRGFAPTERPEIVVDVAHNPAGAWALVSALSEYFDDGTQDDGTQEDQTGGEQSSAGRPMVLLFAACVRPQCARSARCSAGRRLDAFA